MKNGDDMYGLWENYNDDTGRLIIYSIAIEEQVEATGEPVFTATGVTAGNCNVTGLEPGTTYEVKVSTTVDGVEQVQTRMITTLPCTALYPAPDEIVSYADIVKTGTMSVTFPQAVTATDVTKISVSPADWTLPDDQTEYLVVLGDSDDPCTVVYHVNSTYTYLMGNKDYTISFAEGAFTFADGTSSPAFSYSFATGEYPSAVVAIRGVDTLHRNGNCFTSNDTSAKITVYNLMGRAMLSAPGVVDLTQLPAGIYIVKCGTTAVKCVR